MKLELELELTDVHGGDGQRRLLEIEETKLSRTKSRTRTRKDIGVPVQSQMQETATEKSQKWVETFRRDAQGRPVLRLGGAHGKLWGALKEAAEQLASIGDPAFESMAGARRLVSTVYITPTFVPLEVEGESRVEILPQILNGMGRSSMVEMRYDVLPKARAKITVEFPDIAKAKVETLLTRVQGMGVLNKRRSALAILPA